MNFIKKVVEGRSDDFVHIQFQKFGKGEFRYRALIEAKKTREKYTIKTSAEFANELVLFMAKKLGENKTRITGAIVSTSNLKGDLEFKDIKQFQGVKRYIIDNEMSGLEILNLLEKFPKNFFALSFSVGENILKIKPKAPKSGKPGSKNEETPKADFCSLKTDNSEIAKAFIFENPNFKNAKINHTFFIEKIQIPEELKNSTNFALIREKSKRVGRILRKGEIDGKNIEKEYTFEA